MGKKAKTSKQQALVNEVQSLLDFAASDQEVGFLTAVKVKGSMRGAAKSLSVAESTLRITLKRIRERKANGEVPIEGKAVSSGKVKQLPAPISPIEDVRSANDGQYRVQGEESALRSMTDDQILEMAGVASGVWQVTGRRYWQTTMKGVVTSTLNKETQERVKTNKPIQVWNAHFTLKRVVAEHIQDALAGLLKDWKPDKLPKPKGGFYTGTLSDPHMIEIDFFDAHWGKLSHKAGMGEFSDLKLSAKHFTTAFHKVLDRTNHHNAEKFLLPIGNDFFQVDNFAGTTTAGTVVSADNRFSKVFDAGFTALQECVALLRDIAPVECVWVPGNHDYNASHALVYALKQRFWGDKHVSFDSFHPDRASLRSFHEYGDCVISFQHGDKMKPDKAVLTAGADFPDWTRKKHREIHMGHFHTKREYNYMSTSEEAGTTVRYLNSLSATDKWHYENGFIGNKRAAEVFGWGADGGLVNWAPGDISGLLGTERACG